MADKGIAIESTTAETKEIGKNYLVAIAIDEYAHCAPLYNCVRDAKRLIRVLTDQYQFSKEDTFTLFNEDATEYGIIQLFKSLVPLIQPADSLIVVYSGHGEYERDIEEGYWIPVDAPLGDSSDYISNSRIVKYIRAIQAQHTFFIVDSCFSGSLFASRSAQQPTAAARLDRFASRWLLTAGRNEVVSDGKPGDHSPFADNVIYFLEQNEQPYLSVVDLIQHVITAVISNARQTPRGEPLQDVGHRGGQFYFYQKGYQASVSDTTAPVSQPTIQTRNTVQKTGTTGSNKKWWAIAAGVLGLLLILLFIPQMLGNDKSDQPKEDRAVEAAQQMKVSYDSLVLLGQNTLGQANTNSQIQESLAHFQGAQQLADAAGLNGRTAREGIQTAQSRLDQFSLSNEASTEAKTEVAAAPTKPQASKESLAWQKASQSNQEANYRRYLERYPRGDNARTARESIAAMHTYRLSFQPSIKTGKQLEIRAQNGKAPYQVRVTYLANNRSISRSIPGREVVKISLSEFNASQGKQFIEIELIDSNFKRSVQKLPLI